LLLTLLGVFLVTFLATPTLGADWAWDISNGIGFAALAGLLYLCVSSGAGFSARAHQVFGFVVLGAATAHAFGLLFIDAAVIEYLKPGAPVYMWAGVLGFILLALLILIGLPGYRVKLHTRYSSFKYWHRILAIGAIIGAGYHVAASGFYLSTSYQRVMFVIGTGAILAGYRNLFRAQPVARSASIAYLAAGLLCVVVFSGLRNLSF